jgi:ABC-type nickel/cobalt efflux system permease component RcnA
VTLEEALRLLHASGAVNIVLGMLILTFEKTSPIKDEERWITAVAAGAVVLIGAVLVMA